MEWIDLGYFGLFLSSFLSATVLPFSSEAVLTAMLIAKFDPFYCLINATMGNFIGGLTSYYAGYYTKWDAIDKYFKIDHNKINNWLEHVKKYGEILALLSWLPLIGDIIILALGLARANVWSTSILMFIGKLLRYAAIIYIFNKVS